MKIAKATIAVLGIGLLGLSSAAWAGNPPPPWAPSKIQIEKYSVASALIKERNRQVTAQGEAAERSPKVAQIDETLYRLYSGQRVTKRDVRRIVR